MNTRRNASQRLIAALAAVAVGLFGWAAAASGQDSPRARDLGVPFEGSPGPLNAITDVAGIEVGHHTIIRGDGELVVGEGPVRTGVTAVLPRGRASRGRVFAAWFTLNGNGEMTGTTWMRDRGILEGAVMITNTHSVGAVHEATIAWAQQNLDAPDWSLPVVAETWDGFLNDINGFHVRQEHVFAALDSRRGAARSRKARWEVAPGCARSASRPGSAPLPGSLRREGTSTWSVCSCSPISAAGT